MKIVWIIFVTLFAVTIGMFALLAILMKGAEPDRFHDASSSIYFAIDRNIYLDSTVILAYDTIVTNDSSQFLFPVSAWIEKKPAWEEYTKNLKDSVQFSLDTVRLVVVFDSFIDHGVGRNVVEFHDEYGNRALFQAHLMEPMAFAIPVVHLKDTLTLMTNNKEQIHLLKKGSL